jgi:tellurite resistance protein TerC
MHENEVPFINGGEPITAIPEISTLLSLAVIIATIAVATVFSLRKTEDLAERHIAPAQHTHSSDDE